MTLPQQPLPAGKMDRIRDWLAYVLVGHVLPHPYVFRGRLKRVRDKLELWLLPYAGSWAYRDHDFGQPEAPK